MGDKSYLTWFLFSITKKTALGILRGRCLPKCTVDSFGNKCQSLEEWGASNIKSLMTVPPLTWIKVMWCLSEKNSTQIWKRGKEINGDHNKLVLKKIDSYSYALKEKKKIGFVPGRFLVFCLHTEEEIFRNTVGGIRIGCLTKSSQTCFDHQFFPGWLPLSKMGC